jgi:hypothetical protein
MTKNVIDRNSDQPKQLASHLDWCMAAYTDGRKVGSTGSPRLPRPNYLTAEERESYDAGWNIGAASMAQFDLLR